MAALALAAMKHIGWRLEKRRVNEPDVTFVTFWDVGHACPFEDDGSWKPGREHSIVHLWDEWPTKATEVKSIKKLWAEE